MKIPVTLQIVLLTIGMTGFYAMVGQSVPQKEVHPPEVIEIAEDISSEEMVEIGKGIFEGKGICNTCQILFSRDIPEFRSRHASLFSNVSHLCGLEALLFKNFQRRLNDGAEDAGFFVGEFQWPTLPSLAAKRAERQMWQVEKMSALGRLASASSRATSSGNANGFTR